MIAVLALGASMCGPSQSGNTRYVNLEKNTLAEVTGEVRTSFGVVVSYPGGEKKQIGWPVMGKAQPTVSLSPLVIPAFYRSEPSIRRSQLPRSRNAVRI